MRNRRPQTRRSGSFECLCLVIVVLVGCTHPQAPTPLPPVVAASPDPPAANDPPPFVDPGPIEPATASESPRVEVFSYPSRKLSHFAGRPVEIVASVLTPPNFEPRQRYPIFYHVHGFGGSHRTSALSQGSRIVRRMLDGTAAPIVHVFLDANHAMGHHVFADSENTGPWGTALVEEFIPAVETRFAGHRQPWARFVGGHSSGGWSSLWLQVAYPNVFGGVWSTAPDPVDFRDFTGIDIYRFDNAYRDPSGAPIHLVREPDGSWKASLEQYVRDELATTPIGGQFYSFDAVFSPRGPDDQPRMLFDRQTGAIDNQIAHAWRKYDISLRLRKRWTELRDDLEGKLHVFVGTRDTYRLEGAVVLLKQELDALGASADIVFIDGRTHGNLYAPHPEHYPKGLAVRIEQEAWRSYQAHRPDAPPQALRVGRNCEQTIENGARRPGDWTSGRECKVEAKRKPTPSVPELPPGL